MAEKATLFKEGVRQEVEVGSKEASTLFGQGFQLEQSFDPDTGVSTAAQTDTSELASLVAPEADEIDVSQVSPKIINGRSKFDATAFASEIQNQSKSDIEKFIGGALAEERAGIADEISESQKKSDAAQLKLEGVLEEDFDRNELFKQFRQEAGIKKTETSLNAILTEMNDERASFDRGKNALVGESSTMKLLRGKQALLQDQFNAKMTWLVGKASIIQGNLDRASTLVTRYFNNAIADRTDSINNLATLFNLHNQKLITLTSDEKSIAKEQMSLLTDINKRQESEKDAIRSLMVQNPVAWNNANIDLTKSLDEILIQLSPFMAAEEINAQRKDGANGIPSKFWNDAEDARGDLQKGEAWGSVWNRMRAQYPKVSNETIDTALGGNAAKAGELIPQIQTDAFQSIPPEFTEGIEATGFAREGAFEEWKAKQYKQSEPTQFAQQSIVWQWLASTEASLMTNAQKKNEIQDFGFDPDEFNIF